MDAADPVVDSHARLELAELAHALITGALSTDQFEDLLPSSSDPAISEIFMKGFWPLYSDTADHRLTGGNKLDAGELAFAIRCILFLRTAHPYAWPVRSESDVFWRGLLNAMTFGAFGRSAKRKLQATGDIDAWPFLTMQQFNQATRQVSDNTDAVPSDQAIGTSMKTFDARLQEITATLSRHHQRATYGAVGGLLGRLARSVMSGQPKSMDNSWVVSATTGRPTGYAAAETHPKIEANSRIITTPEDLDAWLRTHP